MLDVRFFLLFSFIFFSSCAFNKFKNNPSEEKIYARIQELKKEERYILAADLGRKFKEHFPQSDKVEEMDLMAADVEFNLGHWDRANEEYEAFVKTYPQSSRKVYAAERAAKSHHEKVRFHKHLDYFFYMGPRIFDSGKMNKLSGSPSSLNHFGLSYFFRPQHGVQLSLSSYGFKTDDPDYIYLSAKKYKHMNLLNYSLNYLHRWKLERRWNLIYGIGPSLQRYSNYDKLGRPAWGLQQSVTMDYCITSDSENPCWNGFFPSVGLLHLYSPGGKIKDKSINGHVLGLILGFRI